MSPTARRLTFLQINDLHGYVEPHPELVREGGESRFTTLGGLARVATLFQQVREETSGAVVALDNGDTFHGTHVAVASRGRALVPMMNALGLDAMTVHWEFAYGPDGVRELAGALHYPVLAINCHSKEDDALVFDPFLMIERAGLNVAVIGLACPIVDKTMPPAFSKGVRFTIGNHELPHWIRVVREERQADLVVVLSHLGFPQDVKLAREVQGIDVLVSGHTHNRMQKPIVENGAIIFQSGCHGSFVGRLDVEVEGGRVVSHRHRLIPVDAELEEEPQMRSLVDAALAPDREALGEVVGSVAQPLHRYLMLNSSMDDVCSRPSPRPQAPTSPSRTAGATARPSLSVPSPSTTSGTSSRPIRRSQPSGSPARRSARCWRKTSSAPSQRTHTNRWAATSSACAG